MNAVIFDMDGVLVDSERVVWESFRYAGEKTGVPDVERMAIIGLGLNDEAWIKRFRQEFGADSDRILEHEEAYLQNFYANGAAPAKKGAQRLLEQLCAWNIPVAVASSSPAAVVRGRLERVGLLQYFTAVISGDMVGRSKPEPDIFLEAARQLGSPAALCTVIEDSPNGLRASRRAGCRTSGGRRRSIRSSMTRALPIWTPCANFLLRSIKLCGLRRTESAAAGGILPRCGARCRCPVPAAARQAPDRTGERAYPPAAQARRWPAVP